MVSHDDVVTYRPRAILDLLCATGHFFMCRVWFYCTSEHRPFYRYGKRLSYDILYAPVSRSFCLIDNGNENGCRYYIQQWI